MAGKAKSLDLPSGTPTFTSTRQVSVSGSRCPLSGQRGPYGCGLGGEEMMHELMFEIHSGLPREGPGSEASTRALEMLWELSERP